MTVPVRAPYPWSAVLRYLSARSTPQMDIVENERYTRQTAAGTISVHYDSRAPSLRCHFADSDRADGLARVRRLFDTEHDPREAARVLARSPVLRARVRKLPGMRIPGCWEPFELCLRVILGQQVSVRAAHTLMTRLAARCPALTADRVADADLGGIGVTGSRLRTIRLLAEHVAMRRIRFEQSWAEVAHGLREIPGFGPWTLAYLALRLGRDVDAFPESDLGLLRAAGAEKPAELRRMAEAWRPFRGYAAMYLWTVEMRTSRC